MECLKINFSKVIGNIKPLHGVNNAPYSFKNQEFVKTAFTDAGIPFSRLHDTEGSFGGAHFVDIPNVFPDFDKDPENPENYDFHLTDEFIKAITDAGTQIVFRLGVTIEWASKKYHIFPPKDFKKWAKICEGIVRHYNEGWADGFYLNIQYWEIWNEPENPPMWTGTKEEYFELYSTASKHLKGLFPHIKIGGYGSCGFYSVTRDNTTDFFKSFVTYFDDFLRYLKETNSPLDFFSWHIYTRSIEEITAHGEYVRKTLDDYGFNSTETSLNEWNWGPEGKGFPHMRDMIGASFVAGAFCAMQNSGNIDTAMYYVATLMSIYNGLFDFVTREYQKTYYSFIAFNELYKLSNHVELENNIENVYACAAANENEGAVLISNYSDEDKKIEVELRGIVKKKEIEVEFFELDENKNLIKTRTEIFRGDIATPFINLSSRSVFLIRLKGFGN